MACLIIVDMLDKIPIFCTALNVLFVVAWQLLAS